MFLRCKIHRKDGKEHHYWSIVENRRVLGGRALQRHVLYLGELNGNQEASWRRTVELFGQDSSTPQQASLFPETHLPETHDSPIPNIGIRISQTRLEHPRQWVACWLGCELWQQLGLDTFWLDKLPPGRQGARWDQILQTLVLYRLIDPGSEWRLHRHWFDHSALADLLGSDFSLAEIHRLYGCHDKILEHKTALFHHLTERWRTLFDAKFEILLYDLTSTYFESNPPEDPADMRRFGYSRDKRSDCVQVVIALIVTPEGFPIAYEVLPGNTLDKTTLAGFLRKIEAQYGKADRIWIMDRGIPTEETMKQMRESDPPVSYLVGTPKGRLTQLEQNLLDKPWHGARPMVKVKLLPHEGETYVLAQSEDRIAKERSMRRRRLRKYLRALSDLTNRKRPLKRDEFHQALVAAKKEAADTDPVQMWESYLQLTEIEQAFKELKGDLAIRPIHHQLEDRIEAHIFISFMAYCLQVTLKARLKRSASGLTPRSVLEKFAAVQMLDVHLPTTDGREVVLTRYTQPKKDLLLLLDQLKLKLPDQAPPKIQAPPPPSK